MPYLPFLNEADNTAETTDTAGNFFEQMWQTIKDFFTPRNVADVAFKVLIAILLIVLAHYLVKLLNWVLFKSLSRTKEARSKRKKEGKKVRGAINYSVIYFLQSLVRVVIYILVVVVILAMFGTDFTGLGTILAGAVTGISLSLQDVISSFAYGIIILTTKEYKIGDYIMVDGGPEGTITKINLLNTVITTVPKETVYIPNNVIGKASVINTSVEPVRLLTIKFNVPTASDIDKIRETLLSEAKKNKKVLTSPSPYMFINSLGDRSMEVALRMYVNNDDYWSLGWDMNEAIAKELKKIDTKIGRGELDIQIADPLVMKSEAAEQAIEEQQAKKK